MPKRKDEKPRRKRNRRDPELQAIYDQSRREFTAADLQKYTVIEKGIPMEQVIAECEAINRRMKRKRA
jgi:hypothetical protein